MKTKTTKPQGAHREWIGRGDDVKSYPFTVVFVDRAVWPACDYFKTLEDAIAAAEVRPSQNVQERKYDGKREVSRLISGTHPAYGFAYQIKNTAAKGA